MNYHTMDCDTHLNEEKVALVVLVEVKVTGSNLISGLDIST